VAEIAAFSKTERYDYEENLKNCNDWFSVMNTAKKDGLEEGEAIGIEKGRAEGEALGILKTAKKMKEEGLDVNVISRLTNLSVDEIGKL